MYISNLPSKSGYTLAGLYDGPDYTTATLYVDAMGNGVRAVNSDLTLYPVFIEN